MTMMMMMIIIIIIIIMDSCKVQRHLRATNVMSWCWEVRKLLGWEVTVLLAILNVVELNSTKDHVPDIACFVLRGNVNLPADQSPGVELSMLIIKRANQLCLELCLHVDTSL